MKSLTQQSVRVNSFRPNPPQPDNQPDIKRTLQDFISGHPCLGAHSVFNLNNYVIGIYSQLGDKKSTSYLSRDLLKFIQHKPSNNKDLYSFLAVFPDTPKLSEIQFEEKLWEQLSKLSEIDREQWDVTVSSDPTDPNFSFSFGNKAFYVIGLHPDSSRKARRFAYPMMVFNYHEQFERLRNNGIYSKMRDKIRSRDIRYSGSVNPMLKDFGKDSEARQYSGRQVGNEWKCPFLNKSN